MALVRGGGLWLENVDQTHLVLASGLKMLMKKRYFVVGKWPTTSDLGTVVPTS